MSGIVNRCLFAILVVFVLGLSGCYMAGNNIKPMADWSTGKEPVTISLEETEWGLWYGQRRVPWSEPKTSEQKQMLKLLTTTSTKALEDSHQFSEVLSYHSKTSAFFVNFSYTEQVDNNIASILLTVFTAGVIPSKESYVLEQKTTFTNRQTGKTLTLQSKETMGRYIWLFALPFLSGHSWDDAHSDMTYRMTQKAIDEARRAGFFVVESGDGKSEFF